MKNNIFGTGLNPLEIPPVPSAWSCDYNILPKVTPSVFKDYTSKRRRVALANNRKHAQC